MGDGAAILAGDLIALFPHPPVGRLVPLRGMEARPRREFRELPDRSRGNFSGCGGCVLIKSFPSQPAARRIVPMQKPWPLEASWTSNSTTSNST